MAVVLVTLAVLLAGCHLSGSGKSAATTTLAPTTVKPTTTTRPGIQTSGERTVLSPLGINVHRTASRQAKVVGTAAQAAVLRVLGYTPTGGGWYEVRGQTATGWILASPSLTAAGTFNTYSSGQFGTLYPATWTYTGPSTAVVFRAPGSAATVTVRSAAAVSGLGRVRPDYGRVRSAQVVVCGVTSDLDIYQLAGSTSATRPGAVPYVAQVGLTLDAHHALGIAAALTDVSQLSTLADFLNSITFPFPSCIGS